MTRGVFLTETQAAAVLILMRRANNVGFSEYSELEDAGLLDAAETAFLKLQMAEANGRKR